MRTQAGREPRPRRPSSTVNRPKTTETRGDDAGKQVKGRKRHILVDTLGLLIAVVITAASVQTAGQALPGWPCSRMNIAAHALGLGWAMLLVAQHLH